MSGRRVVLMYSVTLVVLVLLALGPTALHGLDVLGVGQTATQTFVTTLATSYNYAKDDTLVAYTATSAADDMEVQRRLLANGDIHYVATMGVMAGANAALLSDRTADLVQMPLAASAVLPAYTLSSVHDAGSVDSARVVFSADILAGIWDGTITRWDDAAIASLNPQLVLKGATITVVYCADVMGEGAPLMAYLSAVSASARAAFDAAPLNNKSLGFDALGVSTAGRAYGRACSLAAKLAALADAALNDGSTRASLVFVAKPEMASLTALTHGRMMNAGGGTVDVQTSLAAVTAALTASAAGTTNDQATRDPYYLTNTGGNTTWPLSYFTSMILFNGTRASVDCSTIKALAYFLSWTQINDRAVAQAGTLSHVALGNRQRMEALDYLSRATCNGAVVLTQSVVVAMGPPFLIYNAWASDYNSNTFSLKYFGTSSVEGLTAMVDGSVDLASTGGQLSAAQQAAIPDALPVPVVAYGYVFMYNLPELYDSSERLTLNFQVAADIWLGKVDRWDHPDIVALNEPIKHMLPVNESILVGYFNTTQVMSQVINKVLGEVVQEYADKVGSAAVPAYPVISLAPERVRPVPTLNANNEMVSRTHYAISFGTSFKAQNYVGVRPAAMYNLAGGRVLATREHIVAGITNALDPTAMQINLAPGNESWPMITYNELVLRTRSMTDCQKAREIVDWIYWTQTADLAARTAEAGRIIIPAQSKPVRALIMNYIANVTCDDKQVSSFAACIADGTVCSDHGTCSSGACVCDAGYTGSVCERVASSSSSSSDVLAPVLGTVLPIGFLFLLVVLVAIVAACVIASRRKSDDDVIYINYSELELGTLLGQGGFGEVYRAMWKGQEVAVKRINGELVTRPMRTEFEREIKAMSRLRHPNVVLFMAACRKPPNMCIVMELMSLGSLFDLLHNELIPELPFVLRLKMAYQAAKGMHYLHSSGIAHRDLKSLNLLLDAKWNVKVSDFGLSKLKHGDSTGNVEDALVGTIHWAAPEVLDQSPDAELTLADVYAFGIILWEMHTREAPYAGLTPAAIAVSVLRDAHRPYVPRSDSVEFEALPTIVQDYIILMRDCWSQDAAVRPTFLEVMTRLNVMIPEGYHDPSSSGATDKSLGSSSSSESPFVSTASSAMSRDAKSARRMQEMLRNKHQTGLLTTSPSSRMGDTGDEQRRDHFPALAEPLVPLACAEMGVKPSSRAAPPGAKTGALAVLVTDVADANMLWKECPRAMRDALILYNRAVRGIIARHGGYESALKGCNQGHGMFVAVFTDPAEAVAAAVDVQLETLDLPWPKELLANRLACEQYDTIHGRKLVFSGLRTRAGVHVGEVHMEKDRGRTVRMPDFHGEGTGDVKTHGERAAYTGPALRVASVLVSMCRGGETLVSKPVRDSATKAGSHAFDMRKRGTMEDDSHRSSGDQFMSSSAQSALPRAKPISVYGVDIKELDRSMTDNSATSLDGSGHDFDSFDGEGGEDKDAAEGQQQRAVGTGGNTRIRPRNDRLPNPWCEWVLNYADIRIGEGPPIGAGSYGVVHRGVWKGTSVAIKRFVKQKMNERDLLEFNAELSILRQLNHPNVIALVGATTVPPNVSIVTEYMNRGSLQSLLLDLSVRIDMPTKIKILYDVARGLEYLHAGITGDGSEPIIHRDLKSANILVADNNDAHGRGPKGTTDGWTIKIADFGLSRIKEDNATMTRCGTAAWSAPEIIRGAKVYDEKVDVYAYAVVAWEVISRKRPYENKQFAEVALAVVEGKRLALTGFPAHLVELIGQCWQDDPAARPTMAEVANQLSQHLAEEYLV